MKDKVKIRNAHENELRLRNVQSLYESSFPESERREWHDLVRRLAYDQRFNMLIIEVDGAFAGFLTWWDLDKVRYVEHFAVEPSMRGQNVGTEVIRRFLACDIVPVVLEVELPSAGDEARRRIEFYKRNGFEECREMDYFQPPYAESLPSVPLLLMISDKNNVNLKQLVKSIYNIVYDFSNFVQ